MKQDTKETIGSRGTVAGFRPLISEERWHRGDFTAEMLDSGYRPLLIGEKLQGEDYCFMYGLGPWSAYCSTPLLVSDIGTAASGFIVHHRTRRPLPPPQAETFEAHGYVWYRHVPGEECPVDGDAPTIVLHEDESPNHAVKKAKHWHWEAERYCIIGYRFPDLPAIHTTLQQQQPSAQPVIRGVGPYMAIKDVEKTMQSFQHDTTKQRLATMYHGWCDVAPDSVAECIADVAKVLYPTDAERCDAAFERWWERSVGASGCKTTTRITWETAWSAAKQQKP